MPLANFSHFISLATCIVLGIAQCEHTNYVKNGVVIAVSLGTVVNEQATFLLITRKLNNIIQNVNEQ